VIARVVAVLGLVSLVMVVGAGSVFAQAHGAEEGDSGPPVGMVALAAGIAIGLSAIATGFAQARIGAAGAGAMAERPELRGTVILLVAIPETMVILGFVIAAMIVQGM
jgi:V/A-type H+-transporting ATPase subunit K